ncbi:MAG TPA: pectate lyase [Polyangia bacterium]
MSRAQQLTSAAVALAGLALAAAACGDARLYVYDKPGPPPNCPPTMVGYAAVGGMDPDGGALEPTTGGGDPSVAPRMTVTTVDALTSALQQPDPLVIYLDGMLSPPAAVKVTVDKSTPGGNKTLIGVGDSSGLTGAGLDLSYASNVIVRNLKISKAHIGEGDAITLLASHHVWVDHCDLSSARDDTTAGYDGLVDITHGSSYITVSWTVFHDHKDTSLVGHTNDPAQSMEDAALSVTYHHNLFRNVDTGPRVRWGTAHLFSNHFQTVGIFGVASESQAAVLVDHNLFEDMSMPSMSITTQYEDPLPGTMTETTNQFPPGVTPDIMLAFPPLTAPYGYTPDSVESVSTIVNSCAGTGKISFP